MTVKVFRLITGEDLISNVKEQLTENKEQVILDNPAQIILQKQGDQVGVAVAPYMPLIDGDVYLNKTAIVSMGNPDRQMENEYNIKFGSGLVVAGADALNQLG